MGMNLKRSRKSNGVSWAPAVNLCQAVPVENDLPPGFEARFPVSQSKVEVPHIPQIQWKCPSKFVMNEKWLVAAGEESEEAKTQKLREMRGLEAVYPRFSAIPANPSVSLEVEAEYYNDSLTPVIPIIPIEEQSPDLPSGLETPVSTTVESQQPSLHQGPSASGNLNAPKCNSPGLNQPLLGKLLNQNVDVSAAASTVLTAILKTSEKGSLIDTGLLIKILSDPKMVQKLINESGVAPTNSLTALGPKTTIPSVPSSVPNSAMPRTSGGDFCRMSGTVGTTVSTTNPFEPGLVQVQVSGLNRSASSPPLPRPESNLVMLPRMPNQNRTQPSLNQPLVILPRMPNQNQTQPSLNQLNQAPLLPQFPVNETGPGKDVNYYKNLILQHGVEKQEKHEVPIFAQNGNNQNYLTDLKKMGQNYNSGELKRKNAKPCMYFKSPNGCRNGVNCSFQHDMPFQWRTGNVLEGHTAKRMKLGGGNFGRI